MLVSNGACLCGFTKNNYEQLVELDKRYGGNLQIIMFPSNEFGGQEPYDASGIKQFVQKYGVEFFMMEKTHVNGPETHPVIKALKQATGTENVDVKWNFETKFLIAKDGLKVERYTSAFETKELIPFIDRLLAEPSPAASL